MVAKSWTPILSRRREGKRMVICDWRHQEASEFSAWDAIAKACNGDPQFILKIEELIRPLTPGFVGLVWLEDGATLARVLKTFDAAILRAARSSEESRKMDEAWA